MVFFEFYTIFFCFLFFLYTNEINQIEQDKKRESGSLQDQMNTNKTTPLTAQ